MANTFYNGYRSVLRGRNAKNFINPYTGKVGVYSNWAIHDTQPKLLAGMPEVPYQLGDRSQAGPLELMFVGTFGRYPMRNAGGGIRLPYHRTHPYEYKGLNGARAFRNGYGHPDRVTSYSQWTNWFYSGVPAAREMYNPGHPRRFNTTYGGASDPHIYKGLDKAIPANFGHAARPTSEYGSQNPNIWKGTPSSRAL